MKLEDEIIEVLKNNPKGMTVHAIADQLRKKGIFNENDSKVCYFQVHARTHNMPHLFERKGEKIKLKQAPEDTNH